MRGPMFDFLWTFVPILERAGKLFGGVEIVSRQPDRSLALCTYGDVYRRARRLGRALELAGMARGDRVATLMWNHAAHLECYLGIPAAGAVLQTLNLRLHPDELAYIANHAEDRVLIVDDVLLPLYEKFCSKSRFERVLVVPTRGIAAHSTRDGYESFLESGSPEYEFPEIEENEAAAMCYTSGTTGLPK